MDKRKGRTEHPNTAGLTRTRSENDPLPARRVGPPNGARWERLSPSRPSYTPGSKVGNGGIMEKMGNSSGDDTPGSGVKGTLGGSAAAM